MPPFAHHLKNQTDHCKISNPKRGRIAVTTFHVPRRSSREKKGFERATGPEPTYARQLLKGWRSGELLTGVEALSDGGGVAEEAAAERAREARREGRPPQHHHVPGSSVPSRSRRRGGAGGWRLAGEHGALHAASRRGRGPPSRLSPASRSIALLAASISSAATATVRRALWGLWVGGGDEARPRE